MNEEAEDKAVEIVKPITGEYRPGSTAHMITKTLGYCCPYAFFYFYRKNRTIADRLGLSIRTIRECRDKAMEEDCRERPGCCLTLIQERQNAELPPLPPGLSRRG